jgi:hypothetical protein
MSMPIAANNPAMGVVDSLQESPLENEMAARQADALSRQL